MKSLITAEEARHLGDQTLQKYISIVRRIKSVASHGTSIIVKNEELPDEVCKRLSLDGFTVVVEKSDSDFYLISWDNN